MFLDNDTLAYLGVACKYHGINMVTTQYRGIQGPIVGKKQDKSKGLQH